MTTLRRTASDSDLDGAVSFHGWIEHPRIQEYLARSDIFVFPSIREFGGAVVLEAMALGVVPIVVDYGGPGEHVDNSVGFKVPLSNRGEIVRDLQKVVGAICDAPAQLEMKSLAARHRVQTSYTWGVKAGQIVQIYDWVLKRRNTKPSFSNLLASPTDHEALSYCEEVPPIKCT
jgi:glycosyltransferase involved in cell wall biosynthesis